MNSASLDYNEVETQNNLKEVNENENLVFSFDETAAVTVLGRNKLNVYIGDELWQIKGSKRFNALKYVHFYYRYNNLKKGDDNVFFLGL